ncbi:MAG TPA: PKD domain-containing protein [Bacteroidia bacterium]|nr:PKD domain-containing protein [Bacteroidia bacterium]
MNRKNYFKTLMLIVVILFNGCKKDNDSPKVAPVASFSYSGASVPAPATVTFTNNSTNATSYAWDFGDNGTSTEKDPQHTYTAGGVYAVQLTATGPGGTNSITKTVNIQNPTGPTAAFTFTGGGCQAPCIVSFTDASIDATSWNWDFGDGQTSTQQNPTHTYTTGNNFSVQLSVSGPNGSNSTTKSVSVLAPPTVCKISNISIITCPLTDGGGTSWDAFSAPDFYVNLETTSGTVLIDGSGSYNTDISTFPQSWNISPTYNIPSTNWNTTYRIHIWEHDSPDPDDDVSFCNFMLNNYTTVGNHYPTQFTITSGATQIKLTVQWQ